MLLTTTTHEYPAYHYTMSMFSLTVTSITIVKANLQSNNQPSS